MKSTSKSNRSIPDLVGLPEKSVPVPTWTVCAVNQDLAALWKRNRQALQPWRLGMECGPPRHGAHDAFLWVGTWSIDSDAYSVGCSGDLRYRLSGADVTGGAVGAVAGEVEFEIEEAAVGFAVGRDRIGFVDGEDV